MTIAPVKSPIKPEKIKPPITPINITSIGTDDPFPRNIGVKNLSTWLAIIKTMVQIMATVVDLTANKYMMIK